MLQNTKKYIWSSHTRFLKFISAPLKAKHFIGQLWSLMTASNVDARTQVWQARWTVFKTRGLSASRSLLQAPAASVSFLSSPPPPRSFTVRHFCAVFDSRSSFFAPKPHGNACYAGYAFRRHNIWSRENVHVIFVSVTAVWHLSSEEKGTFQGHPTMVFCKISVRRSKYCQEFSIAWGRLKISKWSSHSWIIFSRLI